MLKSLICDIYILSTLWSLWNHGITHSNISLCTLWVILCLHTAAEQLTWLMIKSKLLKFLIIFLLWQHPLLRRLRESQSILTPCLTDIGMIALEWMDMTLISLIWGGGVQVGGEGVVVVGRGYFLSYFRAVLDTRPHPSFLQNHWEDCG